MNKADLNRKIQVLEEQNKALLKINRDLLRVECPECAALRAKKHEDMMAPFRAWQQILDSITHKYY
jgi:hypothetical protein